MAASTIKLLISFSFIFASLRLCGFAFRFDVSISLGFAGECAWEDQIINAMAQGREDAKKEAMKRVRCKKLAVVRGIPIGPQAAQIKGPGKSDGFGGPIELGQSRG